MTIWNRIFPFGKSAWVRSLEKLRSRLPHPDSVRDSWLHRIFGDRIFHPDLWIPTRSSLAMGLAIGWFFGLLPVFGLQIALALVFGLVFRGHFPKAVLGTFITNPFTTPAILVGQYGLGQWLCTHGALTPFPAASSLPEMILLGLPLILGSGVSATVFAVLGYGLIWLLGGSGRIRRSLHPKAGLRATDSGS
jgi:uncharacterized protein